MEVVLTIAGSDTSAGAGIQQDLKTITAMSCYAATVITAITSQNTVGVQGVMPVPAEVVASQIRSVLTDLDVRAVKIGMIPNLEVARVICEELGRWSEECGMRKEELGMRNVVWDPVMISTSGTRLMAEDCVAYLQRELAPRCTLITPNLPESALFHRPYVAPMLIKGGHAEGEEMTDRLILPDGTEHTYTAPRIETRNLHGTGCTLSSAIASALAKGHSLPEAVALGKRYMSAAIAAGQGLTIGHGNGPLGIPRQ